MESYIIEWLSMLGRWLHMITGIAWIGASFYFIWLDNHLENPAIATDRDKGVAGELWSVHGGGFYHAQKYRVSPETLPATLHWFKWEAYTTWLSGMFLLVLLYWYGAEIYLIDPSVMALSKPVAIVIAALVLVLGWLGYDQLCKSRIGGNEKLVALVMLIALSAVAWVLCQLFSGRGAFMHFGAMLGTIMVANVFFVIIPGQQGLVTAKLESREPDPANGIRGKQRSVHNTYFTLPVLFVMISNHYALTYGSRWNWLVLIAIALSGALIRVYFVQRHSGKASLPVLLVALALLGAVSFALAPAGQTTAATTEVSDSEITQVIQARCTSCHSVNPVQPGFSSAPNGVALDTLQDIERHKAGILQQVVTTQVMPIGNLTNMSAEERALVGQWVRQNRQ